MFADVLFVFELFMPLVAGVLALPLAVVSVLGIVALLVVLPVAALEFGC